MIDKNPDEGESRHDDVDDNVVLPQALNQSSLIRIKGFDTAVKFAANYITVPNSDL